MSKFTTSDLYQITVSSYQSLENMVDAGKYEGSVNQHIIVELGSSWWDEDDRRLVGYLGGRLGAREVRLCFYHGHEWDGDGYRFLALYM